MSLDRWLPSLSLPSFLPYQLYSKGAGTQRVGGSHAWQDSIRQREGDSDNTYIQYKTQSRYKTERDVEPHGRLFVYAPCKAPYGPRPPSALPCSHQQWRGRGRALHHRLCNMASNEVRSIIFTARSPVTRSAEVEISDRNVGPKLTSVHVHHRRRPSQQTRTIVQDQNLQGYAGDLRAKPFMYGPPPPSALQCSLVEREGRGSAPSALN